MAVSLVLMLADLLVFLMAVLMVVMWAFLLAAAKAAKWVYVSAAVTDDLMAASMAGR